MWQALAIYGRIYFFHTYSLNNNSINCILYGIEELWYQQLDIQTIIQSIETLNNRLKYSDFVQDALLDGFIETASLEKDIKCENNLLLKNLLKVKYRVHGISFKFEWPLQRQTTAEFHEKFLTPLMDLLRSRYQEIEFMKTILRKKEAELYEYRREGFVLRRKTMITPSFDFNKFDQINQQKCTFHYNGEILADLITLYDKYILSEENIVENQRYDKFSLSIWKYIAKRKSVYNSKKFREKYILKERYFKRTNKKILCSHFITDARNRNLMSGSQTSSFCECLNLQYNKIATRKNNLLSSKFNDSVRLRQLVNGTMNQLSINYDIINSRLNSSITFNISRIITFNTARHINKVNIIEFSKQLASIKIQLKTLNFDSAIK